MEFVKKDIRNYTWKVKNAMQFTIDDTVNIPENCMDMERLVLVKGNVVIEEAQAQVSRFQVRGTLNYQILYNGDKEGTAFDSITGKIPFMEYINADGTKEGDYIEVHACLNDLTVTMLHSRKVSVKALIGLDYQVKENESFSALVDVESEEDTEVLKDSVSMMALKLQSKERVQVKEQVEIPANKPNIYQVVWKSMSLTGMQVKAADEYLLATGILDVFVVYTAEEEGLPLQYFTIEVPFEQRIMEEASSEDMISGSFLNLDQYHITVIPDENGEDRLIDLSAELSVEMKLYGNEELSLVKDVYSNKEELVPSCKDFTVQRLLLRNCAKTKVSEIMEMPKQQSLLHICNVEGSVSIDETQRTSRGILVEGVVATQMIYLNKEENGNLASSTFDIPFSYEIEVNGMHDKVTFSIVPYLDQLVALQINENQVEIKAEVSLDVLAFANEQTRAVLHIEEKPVDMDKKKQMPGLVGYIVEKNDTLWSVAKAYHTTMDRIRELNDLQSDELSLGDKLVIMKE